MTKKPSHSTSWNPVEKWYNRVVGKEGHYYHQHVVIPGVLRLIKNDEQWPSSLLDLACGQGVLARHIPPTIDYLGVDIAPGLIAQAKRLARSKKQHYIVHDITQPIDHPTQFDIATVILALQNIEHPEAVIRNLSSLVRPGGKVVLVLNHPCFRIPRQSFWQVDEQKQCRYRRLERYLTPMKIPIQMQPSKGEESVVTWSFHHPLSDFSKWLNENGFLISTMEEWCSDKQSTGRMAKMENASRKEFPLFLTIVAQKT